MDDSMTGEDIAAFGRDVGRTVREVLAAYPDHHAVYRRLRYINDHYGARGVCALGVGLVRESAPSWALHAGHHGALVVPFNTAEPGSPLHGPITDAGRFIAAVVADDMDMAIAIFGAATQDPDQFYGYLHVLIATCCKAARDG